MRVNKGSLSTIILDLLVKTVDSYVEFEHFAYNPGLYTYGNGKMISKSALSKALRRLKNQDLVEQVIVNNKTIIKLTTTGQDYLKDQNLENQVWDKKFRVVIFDIPENKRIVRNLFRRNLKKWGFVQLQKSVWVSKKDVIAKLASYIKDLKLDPWILVFETDKIIPDPKI